MSNQPEKWIADLKLDIKYIPNRFKCTDCKSKVIKRVSHQGIKSFLCDSCSKDRLKEDVKIHNKSMKLYRNIGKDSKTSMIDFTNLMHKNIKSGKWKMDNNKLDFDCNVTKSNECFKVVTKIAKLNNMSFIKFVETIEKNVKTKKWEV